MSQFAKTDPSDFHRWETRWLSPDYRKTANSTYQYCLQRNVGTGMYRLSRGSILEADKPTSWDEPVMNEQMLYDLMHALRIYLNPPTP